MLLTKLKMSNNFLKVYSYYDILLFSIPIILAIVVIIFRLCNSGDNIEFIGLSPLKVMEIFSNEINSSQLDELSVDDIISRDKSNDLTGREQIEQKNKSHPLPAFNRESRGEAECRRALVEMFNKEFIKVRPEFLKNPNTKRCLELDCYNKELRLAIEYQGEQHYNWPNYTRQTFKDFKKQLWRDDFKLAACETNNIYLIRVSCETPVPKIQKFIYEKLPPDLQFIADQNMR